MIKVLKALFAQIYFAFIACPICTIDAFAISTKPALLASSGLGGVSFRGLVSRSLGGVGPASRVCMVCAAERPPMSCDDNHLSSLYYNHYTYIIITLDTATSAT